jgi:TP901 family phage tail tape measure protein
MAASYQLLFELNAAMGGGFTSAFTQGSQQIENMKNKLDDLNAAGSTGDLLGGISSVLSTVGVVKGLQEVYDTLEQCVEVSAQFETAMAGVKRTVGGSDDFIAGLGESFKKLSTEMPITSEELASIATTAGQLGIAQQNVESFTSVMAQLATTTDLTADDAATLLAQFSNITGTTDFERLGSTVAALGDSTATTASKVVQMSQGMAASASQAGMSERDILAISAAVGSLGIEAQAGSTAMSTLISTLYKSTETGDKLEQFASVAGMTAEQFKQAWGEDAVSAMNAFIQGLNDTERNGKSAVVILDELGITNVRQTKAILGLASAGNLLTNTISQANAAWAENTALGEKAGVMYNTTEAKITMMQNAMKNVQIAVGDALSPMVADAAEAFTNLLEPIAEFIEQNPALVQGITAFVTVLGIAAGAIAAYTAFTKLAAAANLLFAGSIPGIGIILAVAAGIGALVAGIGALVGAYDDAHPSFEKLNAQFDELNDKAKKQQEIIDLAEEYKVLVKDISDLESKSQETKIKIDAIPGETVSVSGDLVVDKDGNVYAIDAETGKIVSVANELVTDKDGNTYLIDAAEGHKVSVKGDLVTDKNGNTYVIDAESGRHVSVKNDLVIDKDGNVYMIDAKTGTKVSVKYDLVTEKDGTQYIINAVTGTKIAVKTDLVYGNSEEELRQVINASAGNKVSVSGELVIDKEGNTYVINARTGQKVSVEADLVTGKDGTVYFINAKTGKKVSVSNDLVIDKDGNVYQIDAKAGQIVSVKGNLVTDKDGNTYVIDAKTGKQVSIKNDLVVDKDGNVYMIDAKTGNKVSVKYDLVTEKDGTQYIINAVTGNRLSVKTNLVYDNSDEDLRQVVNAVSGNKVSVKGELVTDKDGNTYTINAETGTKVSVEADLVTGKDGTVYLINAQPGNTVSVSNNLVVDKDGRIVQIDGKAGDAVSVYSLIKDEEGKTVTITATLNDAGVKEDLEGITEAENESAVAADELAAKRERLKEVTQALRDASGGLITATDQETDALNRQITAYEAVAQARKDQYTAEALETVKKMSRQYVQSIEEEAKAAAKLERVQGHQKIVQEFTSSGDASEYLHGEIIRLAEAIDDYDGEDWFSDSNDSAKELQEQFFALQETINALTGKEHDFTGNFLSGMDAVVKNAKLGTTDLADSWSGAIEEANKYADAIEANDAIQQEYLQNLINGVKDGTLEYDDLRAALEAAFSGYENGSELVEETMDKVVKGVEAAKAAAESAGEAAQTGSQTAVSAVSDVITKIDELRQAYEKAKEAAKETLDGKFKLFDQAGLSDERKSVEEMSNGLQSQTEYWNLYNNNLEAVLNKGLAPEIAKQLADGSQESAEALATLAQASEEEIKSINESFEELESKKDALASTIADVQTGFSEGLAAMKEELDSAVAELDQSTEAAQAAAATMTAYVESLKAEDDNASEAAKTIAANVNAALAAIADVDVDITYHYKTVGSPPSAKGVNVEGENAIGTDYASKGIHLVGEEGPELVYMNGGEKVLTAHETVNALSAAGSGSDNVVYVNFSPSYNVNGGGSAAEIRAVLEEQSANIRDQITEIMEDIVTDKKRVAYA